MDNKTFNKIMKIFALIIFIIFLFTFFIANSKINFSSLPLIFKIIHIFLFCGAIYEMYTILKEE
jgi:hypothetical protein